MEGHCAHFWDMGDGVGGTCIATDGSRNDDRGRKCFEIDRLASRRVPSCEMSGITLEMSDHLSEDTARR